MQESFPSATLQELISAHTDDTQGLILRLAWRVGLERHEIENLQWIQCSPSHITISGRSVPVEQEVASFLASWHSFCEPYAIPYVVISKRNRQHMCGPAISQMFKRTLAGSGIENITLMDLRRDYVRRQLEGRDWQEALQVTGMSVSSYFRNPDLHSLDAFKACHETYKAAASTATDEFRLLDAATEATLQTVMEHEKHSLAGLALRLAYFTPIEIKEIVTLTWDKIRDGQIFMPCAAPIPVPPYVQETLQSIQASRLPGDDPHVFLTERTRKPMDESWLLILVREPLVRMGIGFVTLRSIRMHALYKRQRQALLEALQTRGCVTIADSATILGISQFAAKTQLKNMQSAGDLVRIHTAFYLPDEAPLDTTQQRRLLSAYMATHGPGQSDEMAAYYHMGKRLTSNLLKDMLYDGDITFCRDTGLYSLPSQVTPIDR